MAGFNNKIAISVEFSRYSTEMGGHFLGQSNIKEIFGKISIYRKHQILAQILVKHKYEIKLKTTPQITKKTAFEKSMKSI